jgi:hypothetical protein
MVTIAALYNRCRLHVIRAGGIHDRAQSRKDARLLNRWLRRSLDGMGQQATASPFWMGDKDDCITGPGKTAPQVPLEA